MPHAAEDRLWSWREMTVEKMGLEFGPGVGLYFATLKWCVPRLGEARCWTRSLLSEARLRGSPSLPEITDQII